MHVVISSQFLRHLSFQCLFHDQARRLPHQRAAIRAAAAFKHLLQFVRVLSDLGPLAIGMLLFWLLDSNAAKRSNRRMQSG